jgi:hypothetical protein
MIIVKQINRFTSLLTRLRNAEHYEFFDEIIRFGQTMVDSLGDLRKIWDALVQAFEKEDAVYKQNSKASETKYIAKANQERINARRLIRRRVEAALYDPDPAVRAAAETLDGLFSNYKRITYAPMVELSALTTNMIQEFHNMPYAAAVDTLALAPAVDSLKAINDKFIDLYVEREQSIERIRRMGTMPSVRRRNDAALVRVVEALNGLHTAACIAGDTAAAEVYGTLIDRINGAIMQYELVYTRRSGRSVSGRYKSGHSSANEVL